MFENTLINSILAVIGTVLVCFLISTLLPGIERKYIHARIQQRIGPVVMAPGIMAPIKFMFKENVEISSPVPGLYKSLPIICFIVVLCVLIALTPQSISGTCKFSGCCRIFKGRRNMLCADGGIIKISNVC